MDEKQPAVPARNSHGGLGPVSHSISLRETFSCLSVMLRMEMRYVLNMFLMGRSRIWLSRWRHACAGMSDEGFRKAFGTEEQCRAALVRLRWPDGFVCPSCGHRGHCVLAGRGLYQCNRCKKQTSPTAGTIFHATKLPLTLWFAAIHLIVTAKNGISSVELGRRLGVKQPTALGHEAQDHGRVMARREGREAACGAGGDGRRLSRRQAFRQARPGCRRQDTLRRCGLDGFRGTPAQGEAGSRQGLSQAGDRALCPALAGGRGARSSPMASAVGGRSVEGTYAHRPVLTGSGPKAGRAASFKWVNTALSNIKCAITGTYRKIGPNHAERYPRQLRLALQSALSAPDHDPALRPQRRTNPTDALPHPHRRMRLTDKQELFYAGSSGIKWP